MVSTNGSPRKHLKTFAVWKQDVNQPNEIQWGLFDHPEHIQQEYSMYGFAAVPVGNELVGFLEDSRNR